MAERSTDRVLAVVQARMSSTRLPGKVLADVVGEPLLSLLLRRLRAARSLDELVVATSTDQSDDPIEALCAQLSVRCHRGPLEDVLARFVGAIEDHAGRVVRITADCPLIDAAIVDEVVMLLGGAPQAVYASNVEPRTYPDGLDVEVFRAAALREVNATNREAADREHVTAAFRRNPATWPGVALVHEPDLGSLRWTVDDQGDLDFVRALIERLGERRHAAGLEEMLAAVRRAPSLAAGGLRG